MSTGDSTYKLPEGWIWTTIGEIGIVTSGGTPSTKNSEFWNGDIPWVTPADLSNYRYVYIEKGLRNISDIGMEYSSAKLLPKGSILFSSRAPIGYVAIAKNELATNQGFKNIIPTPSLYSEYVFYYLKTIKPLAEKLASGTTFLELSASKFAQIPIPLPPLPQQKRIVSKIEEVFSELDHAEEGLKKARKQLEVYRQALLKSAFEGKLTEKWRKENISESKIEIIERINKTRKQNFSFAIKKWEENTENLKNLSSDKRLLKPKFDKDLNIISNLLKPIPNGWFYASFGSITENHDDLRKPLNLTERKEHKSNYPYYGATEVIDYVNDYLFDDKFMLIGEDGANLFSKNKPLSIIVDGRFWVNNHAHVVKTNENEVNLKYLNFYFNTLDLAPYITGTAQPKLNRTALDSIPVVICNITEQIEIVQKLESKFSLIDNLNSTIIKALNNLTGFRHSIFKKAFEGKLTPQNSNEESASALIKRIQKEKHIYFERLKNIDREKPKRKETMEKSSLSIKEVLQQQSEPISVWKVWKQSKFQEDCDIDQFYAELKELEESILIKQEGKETLITWGNEN